MFAQAPWRGIGFLMIFMIYPALYKKNAEKEMPIVDFPAR